MPARKIPRSYRNVTGRVAHAGTSAHFESPLERDFYRLLRFNPDVQKINAQPVAVPFVRADGSSGHCFPDVQVIYRPLACRRPGLFEVKERAQIKKDWKELKPKFRAARKWATAHGWTYKIVTEKEIRTPYLHNVDFLQDYLDREVDHLRCQRMLRALRSFDGWSIDKLVDSMSKEFRAERVELLPLVWHLVATRQILMDLEVPLNTRTPISACKAVA
jgi:hypothetical protein